MVKNALNTPIFPLTCYSAKQRLLLCEAALRCEARGRRVSPRPSLAGRRGDRWAGAVKRSALPLLLLSFLPPWPAWGGPRRDFLRALGVQRSTQALRPSVEMTHRCGLHAWVAALPQHDTSIAPGGALGDWGAIRFHGLAPVATAQLPLTGQKTMRSAEPGSRSADSCFAAKRRCFAEKL